jgi:signal transduction histidine kinase
MRLLKNIARQASAAVHAAQLTEELQRSRHRLVTAREEERRRLRRDLHDRLGPSLAALHIQSNALRRLIRSEPEAAETMVDEFKIETREAIGDIRRVVYKLRPPTLDELGLVGAIRAYAAQCSREAAGQALSVNVDAPDNLPPLPAAVEVAAYHILREALTNVVHHSQARSSIVRLAISDTLTVEISDNGVGFQKANPRGMGLLSMRERAEELGGTFIYESLPDGGASVRARFPLIEA